MKYDKRDGLKSLMEQSMLFGLGLFDASRETVESFVDDMLDRGRIQKDEAEALRSEYKARREEEQEELEAAFSDRITEVFLDKLENDEAFRLKVKTLLDK